MLIESFLPYLFGILIFADVVIFFCFAMLLIIFFEIRKIHKLLSVPKLPARNVTHPV